MGSELVTALLQMRILSSVGSLWNAEKLWSCGCGVPELESWLKDKSGSMIPQLSLALEELSLCRRNTDKQQTSRDYLVQSALRVTQWLTKKARARKRQQSHL